MAGARLLIGFVARLAMWAALAVIVVDAVRELWARGEQATAVFAAILFPVTVFVWPWKREAFGRPLWQLLVVALIAYPVSTLVGGLPPVERPGDL